MKTKTRAYTNGYKIRGYCEFLSSIQVPNMVLRYWSIRSSIVRGGDGVKSKKGGIAILASWEQHFIRVCENLIQNPRIFISILNKATSNSSNKWENSYLCLERFSVVSNIRTPPVTKTFIEFTKRGMTTSINHTIGR